MASPVEAGGFALLDKPDQRSAHTSLAFLLLAGLVNALIASYVLCPLPQHPGQSSGSLAARALIYVALAATAGVGGAWLYWKRSYTRFRPELHFPFRLFALATAVGWVWTPAVVLMSRQDSPASVALTVIGAGTMGWSLRHAVSAYFERGGVLPEHERSGIFASYLEPARNDRVGLAIAVAIYGAAYATHGRSNLLACALLAPCAFVVAWKRSEPRAGSHPGSWNELHPEIQARRRLSVAAIPAVLVTLFALMLGSRTHTPGLGGGNSGAAHAVIHARVDGGNTLSGYQSIILWPPTEQKQVAAPLPRRSPLSAQSAQPTVIRFDGSYWYFQPPQKQPGQHAHVARGNPLGVNIQSNDALPLMMEAHQKLDTEIPIDMLRGLDVAIRNRDNRPGPVALGVLLSDSSSHDKASVYLGEEPIASTQVGGYKQKQAAVSEVLRFPVPAGARLKHFDEITILFLPDVEHRWVSPKIAVEQFELEPRW